jgi:hypothetical protein
MSKDGDGGQEVAKIFSRDIRSNRSLEDVSMLVLPDNPTLLAALGACCLRESLRELKAGHHLEGRRLGILGRQLQDMARKGNAK